MGGFAWVTLATNDSYSLGALVLAHSLRNAKTAHKLAVLITPAVSPSMREQLSTVFDLVKVVDVLDSKDEAHLAMMKRPELGVTFTKIHCWRLTEFDKCVFLDADTLVLKNCDELFDREELSAAPDVGWPDCFNTGVFVYKPSIETFNNLIKFSLENGSFDGGDQGLLNQFFSDWATQDIKKHLPFVYNLTSVAVYSYIPAFKQYGSQVRIVHFIGTGKPWLHQMDPATKTVSPAPGAEHLAPMLQLWWDIFCEKVHPSLSTNLECASGMRDDGVEARTYDASVEIRGVDSPGRSWSVDPPVESRGVDVPAETEPAPQIQPFTPYIDKDDSRQINLPYQPFDVKGESGELFNISYLEKREIEIQEQRTEETRMREADEARAQAEVVESREPAREERRDDGVDAGGEKPWEGRESADCHHQPWECQYTEDPPEEQPSEREVEEKEEETPAEVQPEEPAPQESPFNYQTFFPDEACVQSYLEQNVMTYQPLDKPSKRMDVEQEPNLPRFLTIAEDDQRQSLNVWHEEPKPQPEPRPEPPVQTAPESTNHPEPAIQQPVKAPSEENLSCPEDTNEQPKWESMSMAMDESPAPTEKVEEGTFWKSHPSLTVDPNKKYLMPKLKPLLPKHGATHVTVEARPNITQHTEFLMSCNYDDIMPCEKLGFVERQLLEEVTLGASETDVNAKLRTLERIFPRIARRERSSENLPKSGAGVESDAADCDLSSCLRQRGNQPLRNVTNSSRTANTCFLPVLKPLRPTNGEERPRRPRSSGRLSKERGTKAKVESRKAREKAKAELGVKLPECRSTSVEDVLKKLINYSKDYQKYFVGFAADRTMKADDETVAATVPKILNRIYEAPTKESPRLQYSKEFEEQVYTPVRESAGVLPLTNGEISPVSKIRLLSMGSKEILLSRHVGDDNRREDSKPVEREPARKFSIPTLTVTSPRDVGPNATPSPVAITERKDVAEDIAAPKVAHLTMEQPNTRTDRIERVQVERPPSQVPMPRMANVTVVTNGKAEDVIQPPSQVNPLKIHKTRAVTDEDGDDRLGRSLREDLPPLAEHHISLKGHEELELPSPEDLTPDAEKPTIWANGNEEHPPDVIPKDDQPERNEPPRAVGVPMLREVADVVVREDALLSVERPTTATAGIEDDQTACLPRENRMEEPTKVITVNEYDWTGHLNCEEGPTKTEMPAPASDRTAVGYEEHQSLAYQPDSRGRETPARRDDRVGHLNLEHRISGMKPAIVATEKRDERGERPNGENWTPDTKRPAAVAAEVENDPVGCPVEYRAEKPAASVVKGGDDPVTHTPIEDHAEEPTAEYAREEDDPVECPVVEEQGIKPIEANGPDRNDPVDYPPVEDQGVKPVEVRAVDESDPVSYFLVTDQAVEPTADDPMECPVFEDQGVKPLEVDAMDRSDPMSYPPAEDHSEEPTAEYAREQDDPVECPAVEDQGVKPLEANGPDGDDPVDYPPVEDQGVKPVEVRAVDENDPVSYFLVIDQAVEPTADDPMECPVFEDQGVKPLEANGPDGDDPVDYPLVEDQGVKPLEVRAVDEGDPVSYPPAEDIVEEPTAGSEEEGDKPVECPSVEDQGVKPLEVRAVDEGDPVSYPPAEDIVEEPTAGSEEEGGKPVECPSVEDHAEIPAASVEGGNDPVTHPSTEDHAGVPTAESAKEGDDPVECPVVEDQGVKPVEANGPYMNDPVDYPPAEDLPEGPTADSTKDENNRVEYPVNDYSERSVAENAQDGSDPVWYPSVEEQKVKPTEANGLGGIDPVVYSPVHDHIGVSIAGGVEKTDHLPAKFSREHTPSRPTSDPEGDRTVQPSLEDQPNSQGRRGYLSPEICTSIPGELRNAAREREDGLVGHLSREYDPSPVSKSTLAINRDDRVRPPIRKRCMPHTEKSPTATDLGLLDVPSRDDHTPNPEKTSGLQYDRIRECPSRNHVPYPTNGHQIPRDNGAPTVGNDSQTFQEKAPNAIWRPSRRVKRKAKPSARSEPSEGGARVVEKPRTAIKDAGRGEIPQSTNIFAVLRDEAPAAGKVSLVTVASRRGKGSVPSRSAVNPPPYLVNKQIGEGGGVESVESGDVSSADNSGIAGAIAKLSLQPGGLQGAETGTASTAQEDYMRRQNWEMGTMDYMGRDSFDNIWSKICETVDGKVSKDLSSEGESSNASKTQPEPSKSDIVPEKSPTAPDQQTPQTMTVKESSVVERVEAQPLPPQADVSILGTGIAGSEPSPPKTVPSDSKGVVAELPAKAAEALEAFGKLFVSGPVAIRSEVPEGPAVPQGAAPAPAEQPGDKPSEPKSPEVVLKAEDAVPKPPELTAEASPKASEPETTPKPPEPTTEAAPKAPEPSQKPAEPMTEAAPKTPEPAQKPAEPTTEAAPKTPEPAQKPAEPTTEAAPKAPEPAQKPAEPTAEAAPKTPEPAQKPAEPTAEVTPKAPEPVTAAKPAEPAQKPLEPTSEAALIAPVPEVTPQPSEPSQKPAEPTTEAGPKAPEVTPKPPEPAQKPVEPTSELGPKAPEPEASPKLPEPTSEAGPKPAEQGDSSITPQDMKPDTEKKEPPPPSAEQMPQGERKRSTEVTDMDEEGKPKKGVLNKILELVGVTPKSDTPKSVFYDTQADGKAVEEQKPKCEGKSIFYDVEGGESAGEQSKDKPAEAAPGAPSGAPADPNANVPADQEGGKKKSPSPSLSLKTSPGTEIVTATPPSTPMDSQVAVKDEKFLTVDDKIKETPPVTDKSFDKIAPEGKTSEMEALKSEVDTIIDAAKKQAEEQLKEGETKTMPKDQGSSKMEVALLPKLNEALEVFGKLFVSGPVAIKSEVPEEGAKLPETGDVPKPVEIAEEAAPKPSEMPAEATPKPSGTPAEVAPKPSETSGEATPKPSETAAEAAPKPLDQADKTPEVQGSSDQDQSKSAEVKVESAEGPKKADVAPGTAESPSILSKASEALEAFGKVFVSGPVLLKSEVQEPVDSAQPPATPKGPETPATAVDPAPASDGHSKSAEALEAFGKLFVSGPVTLKSEPAEAGEPGSEPDAVHRVFRDGKPEGEPIYSNVPEEAEEIRVTSEEERRKDKPHSSKLTEQILKAIPGSERKPFTEAEVSADVSQFLAAVEPQSVSILTDKPVVEGEEGESAAGAQGGSVPVPPIPPRKNRSKGGKDGPQPPPKKKGKNGKS